MTEKSNAKNSKKPLLPKRKLTAMVPVELFDEMHKLAKGDNLTKSLILVVNDWVKKENLKKLHNQIRKRPLEFTMDAEEIRALNRNR